MDTDRSVDRPSDDVSHLQRLRWGAKIDGRVQKGYVSAPTKRGAEEAARQRYVPAQGATIEVWLLLAPDKCYLPSDIDTSRSPPSTKAEGLVARTARLWLGWDTKTLQFTARVSQQERVCVEGGCGGGAVRDRLFAVFRAEGVPIEELCRMAGDYLAPRGQQQ